MGTVKVAQTLRVERSRAGGHALLYIDGELFPYGTVDGFSVHPRKNELPGVTLTIAAWRVEVCDDVGGGTGNVDEALAGEPAASASRSPAVIAGTSATTSP